MVCGVVVLDGRPGWLDMVRWTALDSRTVRQRLTQAPELLAHDVFILCVLVLVTLSTVSFVVLYFVVYLFQTKPRMHPASNTLAV